MSWLTTSIELRCVSGRERQNIDTSSYLSGSITNVLPDTKRNKWQGKSQIEWDWVTLSPGNINLTQNKLIWKLLWSPLVNRMTYQTLGPFWWIGLGSGGQNLHLKSSCALLGYLQDSKSIMKEIHVYLPAAARAQSDDNQLVVRFISELLLSCSVLHHDSSKTNEFPFVRQLW